MLPDGQDLRTCSRRVLGLGHQRAQGGRDGEEDLGQLRGGREGELALLLQPDEAGADRREVPLVVDLPPAVVAQHGRGLEHQPPHARLRGDHDEGEDEEALFDEYRRTAAQLGGEGTITVLISHRFSSVRMADLIVVLEGGRVVETGSHVELPGAGGRDARMDRQQADAYS